jgi:hypothetical protein
MQPIIEDKESVLKLLMTEGLIDLEREKVDPILLNSLMEDLLIMPAQMKENGKVVYLPGPRFGLKHLPVYVSCLNNKNIPVSVGLSELIDKKSASAARNIMLFTVFKSIDEIKHLINDGNYSEAYELIRGIEYDIRLMKIYYPEPKETDQFHELDREIITLKRKIEIEINIFLRRPVDIVGRFLGRGVTCSLER